MEKDFELLVSRNARYYLFNNQVFDVANSTTFKLDEGSLPMLIQMVGENINFKYLQGEMLFEEVSKFTRQAAYQIFDCFEENKKLNLMMEYEVKFGSNLIIESNRFNQKKVLKETWEFLQETIITELGLPKWMQDAGDWVGSKTSQALNWTKEKAGQAWDFAKEKAGQAWDWTKEKVAKATNWLISKGVPTFMEGLRAVMFSWGGAIVSTILAVTPLSFLNYIAWGALLLWDIMEAINGRANWVYILIDFVGIIFSGGLAKGLMKAITSVFGKLGSFAGKSLQYVVDIVSKTSIGRMLIKGIGTMVNGLGKVVKLAGEAVSWLGTKFGFKSFSSIPGKISGFFDKIVNALKGVAPKVSNLTTKTASKVAEKVPSKLSSLAGAKFGTSTVGKTVGSAALAGGIAYGLSNDKSVFGTNLAKQQQDQMKALDQMGPSEMEVA